MDLLPLRYKVPTRGLNAVPGVKLPWNLKKENPGVPRNCKHLTAKISERRRSTRIDTPPEMRITQDFLTAYQVREILWSTGLPGVMFIWSCGSGKTLAAIWLALSYGKRIVFVCRAPARQQMYDEFKEYTTVEPYVLEGMTPCEIPPGRVCILGWETLPAWEATLSKWIDGGVIIWDEIHKAKNWVRQEKVLDADTGKPVWRELDNISASAGRLATYASVRIGLTATPIANYLSDLWSQLDIIEPTCWGVNWDFVHRYCDALPGEHGGLDTSGRSNTDELNARLKSVWSIVKKEEAVRDLPPLRRKLVYLRKEDQNSPRGFKTELQQAARRGRQALFEMQLMESAARKRTWVIDRAVDAALSGQKVTIFTGRRKDCETLGSRVAEALKQRAPSWWAHGDSSEAERRLIIEAYKGAPGGCVFVGTGDAFGESIDGLQCTDLAIFVMLPYTPKQIVQWEGRFLRRGSKVAVQIIFAIAEGTVDEHVADLLLKKLENVINVLDDNDTRALVSSLSGTDNEDEILARLLEKV